MWIFLLLYVCIKGDFFSELNVVKVYKGEICYPRVIWSFWDNENVPDDIQEMVDVSRKSLQNFTFCFLTGKNLSLVLDVGSFPPSYMKWNSNMSGSEKTDFIRICLIEKFGGVWIDSSIYVNSGKEMEWFFSSMVNAKAQITSFNHHHGQIASSFFAAPENSTVMKIFKREYETAMNQEDIKEYFKKICADMKMKSCPKDFIINTVYAIAAHYSPELNKSSVLLLPAERSHYRLSMDCQKVSKSRAAKIPCMRDRLFNDPVSRSYPFIKVGGRYRNGTRFNIGGSKEDKEVVKVEEKNKIPIEEI